MKIKTVIGAYAIAGSLALGSVCYAAGTAYVSGTVEPMREAGMIFYFLQTRDRGRIFLGAPYEIQENPAQLCVDKVAGKNVRVRLKGTLKKDGKEWALEDFTCVK